MSQKPVMHRCMAKAVKFDTHVGYINSYQTNKKAHDPFNFFTSP